MDCTSPQSLFHQCIHFVAENVDIVDSFVGFPAQIGEQIFEQCVIKKKFVTENLTSLGLFASEFGPELLDSLNLSGEYLCLNFYLEHFLMFTDLTELDLSNCGLGDHHEMLTNFANMKRLEILNLKDNCISDPGIQRMTTPYRMLSKGPKNLKLLDLTDNSEVSVRCLKYLSPFQSLKVLLPGSVPKQPTEFKSWKFIKDEAFKTPTISMQGWASGLIQDWIACVNNRKLSTKALKHTFYTKPSRSKDFTVNIKKSDNMEYILAENITMKTKEQQLKTVSENQSNILGCEDSLVKEEERELMLLYKMPIHTGIVVETISKTDTMVSNKSVISTSIIQNLESYHHQDKQICSKHSKTRLKDSQLFRKMCSASVRNASSSKKEDKTIKEYFKLHSVGLDRRVSGMESDKISVKDSGKKEKSVNSGNGIDNSERKLILLKNACSEDLKVKNTENVRVRKRKRIVISRPLTEANPEERELSVKYQKLEVDVTTDKGQMKYQDSQRSRKTSFLDCLDSFI